MTHMSFHGALGNMAAANAELALVLVEAVARFDAELIISSSASLAIERAGEQHGLRVASSFLADRACDDEGLLVPRALPDSVIHDSAAVLARVTQLLRRRHGDHLHRQDHPHARELDPAARRHPRRGGLAREVRARIEAVGGAHRADFAAGAMMRTAEQHKGSLSPHSQSVLALSAPRR
jgi:UPF0271 protein